MALALILSPLLFAAIAALAPSNRLRPVILPVAAALHLAACLALLARPALASWPAPSFAPESWFALDPPGKLVLLVVSVLFFFCSIYAVGYLRYREERSNRVFVACLLVFLGVASLVAFSRHLGLMWVAIEATTLSTAPLIYFNHSKRSIEATWKYLLVGSVGIALALFGTFFLAYSAMPAGQKPSLMMEDLVSMAPNLSKPWLRAAFILLLVGYGTKMGLAPMHGWKPDAYGEAPGVVGAIFAGGVTSCAFLAFARVYRVCLAAGEGQYVSRVLLGMGLFSMAVAGLLMIGGRDFKRSLAYSSVEHMGILIAGLGIGGAALYGTMLHVATNCATKGVLFLSGFIAITGSPPFGPFASMYSIVVAAFTSHLALAALIFLVLLLIVFLGMGRTVLKVLQGRPPLEASEPSSAQARPYRDGFLTIAPVFALMALVLMLGLWLPAPFADLLRDTASFLEIRP